MYFNIKSERHSYYQALLSLGDRRVAPAIEAAERNGQNWRAAVAEAGVDADFYIFRDRSSDAVLPWDIIDGGMKRSFFEAEFAKSLREEWTLPPKRAQENAQAAAGHPIAHPVIGHRYRTIAAIAIGYPTYRSPDSTRDRRPLLVLLKRLENQLAQLVLRRGVDDRPQQREAAPLAVDAVLPRRERDVAAAAAAPLPDREANQLQPFERAVAEVQLGVGELSRRIPLVVRRNLDRHVTLLGEPLAARG